MLTLTATAVPLVLSFCLICAIDNVLLGHIVSKSAKMRSLATDRVWSLCVCVCVCVSLHAVFVIGLCKRCSAAVTLDSECRRAGEWCKLSLAVDRDQSFF